MGYKKKMKKLAKKLKKHEKKMEKKLERAQSRLNAKPPAMLLHERGLTHDLLHKDLTMIPRKKLVQMAKVCKTRRRHYQYELAICVREKGSDRRDCLNKFNRVKAQVEKRCGKLKELFSRIFKFINDLRVWAAEGAAPSEGSADTMKILGGSTPKSTGKETKKIQKMIKKVAKRQKKSHKEMKKEVKKLNKAVKKGMKEVK